LVLVDAPCSSSGTYKRKPHRKWALTQTALEQIIGTQRHVLDSYARLVRPGGIFMPHARYCPTKIKIRSNPF